MPTTIEVGAALRRTAHAIAPALALAYTAGLMAGTTLHRLNAALAAAWRQLLVPAAQPPAAPAASPVQLPLQQAPAITPVAITTLPRPRRTAVPVALPVAIPAPEQAAATASLPAGLELHATAIPAPPVLNTTPPHLAALTYRQARRRCHAAGLKPGRSRASAIAALAAAGA